MKHLPVMLEEVLEQLAIKTDGYYLDCTFGRGGHSRAILGRLGDCGRLLAIDRDADAVHSDHARALLDDRRFTLRHCCFSSLERIAEDEGLTGKVDGILFDLGVSSPQLDEAGRGFSFLRDGPLDMRMDRHAGVSAEQWLAQVEEQELARVLFDYGEERFARRIARAVIEKRAKSPITSTFQLVELIESAIPVRDKFKHAATRTFQAIRIEINRELEELKDGLRQAVRILKPGGRLVVISFHSLEDRIVKRFIRNESGAQYNPGKLPVREADIQRGELKKVGKMIKAGMSEIARNPRARSAVMRVAEKV
ncbi:MAG: 16S rRNA (cytosine(1402)-N(4))-methyltransferase RsmH [Gammaproteobacteria bacterium]